MAMKSLAFAGLVALVLAASQGAALADWKSNAAKRTVGRIAKEGIEDAAKHAAVDVALEAVVPGGPAAGDVDRGRPDRGTAIGPAAGDSGRAKSADHGTAIGSAAGNSGRARSAERTAIGSAAGEGLEAAMSAANVASSIDAAVDVADTAKRLNKVRKAIR
jgi:hypothetical protein